MSMLKFSCNMLTMGMSILFHIYSVFAFDEEILFAKDTLEKEYGKIIFSSVIFRHGNRTPSEVCPKCEYNEDFWPEGIGQLNNIGKASMLDLGTWFRERYQQMDLIKKGYVGLHDTILMNSSDVDRTLMSAEVFLAGFLPPNSNEVWKTGFRWQPIPVHTEPSNVDKFIGGKATCERFEMEIYSTNQLPKWRTYYEQHEEFLSYLSQNTGEELEKNNIVDAIRKIAHIYDYLNIVEWYNLTLPKWSEKIYPDSMLSLFPLYYLSRVSTKEMQRLQAGPLLGRIVSDMSQKRNNATKLTFHFYSAHDTTIGSVLIALGLYEYDRIPYETSFIIELRKKMDEFYVTMLYRNETKVPPRMFILPECGVKCTLDNFIRLITPIIPENWSDECNVGLIEKTFYYQYYLSFSTISVVGLIVAVVLCPCLLCFCLRKRRRETYIQL